MTTYYVSQTAANGFGVGSDSNSAALAQNQATPWLTLDKFYSSAVDGDTCIINDGTYTATTIFAVNKALTYSAFNTGAVVLRSQPAQTTVVSTGISAGKTATFNGLVFDAQNAQNYCHQTDSAAVTVVWNNCQFINPVLRCVVLAGGAGKYYLTGCTISGAATDGGIVHNSPGSGCVVVIDGLTVNMTNITNNAGSVYLQGAATGATAMIRNVFGTQVNIGSASFAAIQCSNISRLFIGGPGIGDTAPRMKVVAASAPAACVRVLARSSIATDHPVIKGFRGELATVSDGYGIIVGSDGNLGAAFDQLITDPIITNCDIIGNPNNNTSHGLMVGSQIGGVISSNRIRGFGIPIISKLQITRGLISYDNDIDLCVSGGAGAIYSKGSSAGSFHFANKLHFSAGYTSQVFQSLKDNATLTLDTGSLYAFNTAYSSAQMSAVVLVGGAADASTATLVMNNYNLAGGVSGSPFGYQGTTYATLAAWGAAQETTYRVDVPTIQEPTFYRNSYAQYAATRLYQSDPWLPQVIGL